MKCVEVLVDCVWQCAF